MSAHGSPTSGDGHGDLTGSQIAFRMVQAAEAAVAAANAASTAINTLTSSSTGTGGATGATKAEWYKVLPKPSCFEPKDREAELATFRDWWWQVEQYMLAVDANYGHDLQTIRSKLDEEIPLVEQSIEQTRRSAFLYGLLASLLRNRPLLLLKGIEQGNGLEAVRQLFRTCQPSSRNRSLGLLHLIMQWPSFDMKSAILPQILKLEDSFKEYEKIATALSEELKFAVLLKCLSGQLKTYLQVSMRENMTYEELREATLRYDQCTIKWSQSMALGSSVSASNDTSGPMDVDRVEKGKGKKGKSKSGGKGKDKGKGKQKSKSNEKGFHSGKGYGNQQQQSSWNSKGNSWQNSSWNSGGDNSGKGGKSQKGGKSKDSGKGKDVTCHRCGGHGHFARDCRVRMVGQSDNGATSTDGKSDGHAKTGANNAQVNRVSFAPEVSTYRQLDFDISGMSDLQSFSGFHVNMVSNLIQTTTKTTVSDGSLKVCGGDQQFFSACDDEMHGFQKHVCVEIHGLQKHGCGVNEFSKRCASGDSAEAFDLQKLFQLDDVEHFNKRVWNDFSLDMYEVAGSNSCHGSFMRFGDVSVLKKDGTCADRCNFWQTHMQKDGINAERWKPCQTELQWDTTFGDGCNSLGSQSNVRAVSCKHVDIILDSGSDVTLIPMHMAGIGTRAQACPGTYLRDAQGKEIATSDIRDVSFEFETLDGDQVTIKERAFFSDRVDNPLISFGKLLKTGWSIESSNMSGPPLLSHRNGAKVELAFRNNSLVLAGSVRMVQDVRTISVDVPRPWFNLPQGWYAFDGFQVCSSNAVHFIDATKRYMVTDWPYRTTVAYHDTQGWQVIELCEKLFNMDERAAPITGNYARLLTILSKEVLTVSEFGMVISDAVYTEGDGRERSSGSGGSSARPVAGDGNNNPPAAVQAQRQEQPDVAMDGPALPQTVAAEANRSMVKIAGVEVFWNSSIAVLKAACSFLQVSQAGSKQKLWRRILGTLDKQAILAETELAAVALDESQRKADSVQVANPPDDPAEIESHNLTHLPYQAWCPACVMAKGKPEQHRSDPSKLVRREFLLPEG